MPSNLPPVVRVVNVRGLVKPADRAGVVYVGRPFAGWPGHPLANPFKLPRSGPADSQAETLARFAAVREECIARYRAWLLDRPTLDADLAALWAECDRGAKPLGCWCGVYTPGGPPLVCHAAVLADLLAARFSTGET